MRFLLLVLACALTACAHPQKGALESLRFAAETFHQRARWRDFRGAAQLIVTERRAAFERARADGNDEETLSITDYEIEDAYLSPGGDRAHVVSRVSWTRLPSVSVLTRTVTSEFILLKGAWFLARQDAGPFSAELSAEYP